jgi:PAS domain S-box-containing protein
MQVDGRILAGFGAFLAGALGALFVASRRRFEATLRRFVQTAPEAMVLVGSDRRVRSVNAAAERLFGYPCDDVVGWPVERLVPRAFGGGFAPVEGRRSNDSTFPADVRVGIAGNGLLALEVRDRTPLRELEARLEAFATEAHDLYEHAPCGYHSLDAQGRFVRVNETEARWLGLPRDQILGRPFREFLTPAGRALFDASAGVLDDAVVELAAADGSTRLVAVDSTVVRDADGRFLRTRATVVDLTLRKRERIVAFGRDAILPGELG